MNKIYELLKSEQKICQIHFDRLNLALNFFKDKIPFTQEYITSLDYSELTSLDMLTTRFTKLQDAISQKIFPLILKNLGENIENKSFIDILNRMEKLELLPSSHEWRKMRETRNHIVHEYPEDIELMLKNLNDATAKIHELLEYWIFLNTKINNKISSSN